MPPKKAGGGAKKKTANGYKFPDHLNEGTILTDLAKKQWVLGKTLGKGGFGEIYTAKESAKGEERVVKIEPHENGPLFVEMHFFMRAAKPDLVAEYNKTRKIKEKPLLPLLRGSGSYMHKGTENYRFLVIDKLGKDLDKIFENGKNPFSLAQVSSITSQVVTTLEYLHSTSHTHNDIKAANLLLGPEPDSIQIYLVDFGLCVKYSTESSGHKEYKPDPRKMHDGTIEYVSRDGHIGCTSRRSDLEVLVFNVIHWLRGSLPWVSLSADPKKVQAAKEAYVKDIDANIKELPKPVKDFIKYSLSLKFDQAPDYDKLRGFFKNEISKAGKNLSFSPVNSGSATPGKGRKAKVVKSPAVKSSPAPAKRGRKAKEALEDSQSEEEAANSTPVPAPVKRGRKAKVVVEDSQTEEEAADSTPVPAKRGRKAKKVAEDSRSDEEEIEEFESPEPAAVKKTRKPKAVKAKAVKKEGVSKSKNSIASDTEETKNSSNASRKATQVDSLSEDDMFAATPSPRKRIKSQVTEIGVQTSPAFVKAAKAARVGKKALEDSEYIHNGPSSKLTPSSLRRKAPARNTPVKRAGSRGLANGDRENGEEKSNVLTDISNPTPAMLAILKKKEQVAGVQAVFLFHIPNLPFGFTGRGRQIRKCKEEKENLK